MTDVVTEDYAEDRAGIGIVAYRTQGALAFWPLLFLTARQRRTRTAFFIYSAVFFVLAQQILFQKRGPTVRILLFVLVFLVVLPRLRDPRARPSGHRGWATFATAGAAGPRRRAERRPLALRRAARRPPEPAERPALQRGSGGHADLGERALLRGRHVPADSAAAGARPRPRLRRLLHPGHAGLGRLHGGPARDRPPPAPRGGADAVLQGRPRARASPTTAGLALALVRGRRFLREPLAAAAFFVVLLHAMFLLQESWFIMSASLRPRHGGPVHGPPALPRAGSGRPRASRRGRAGGSRHERGHRRPLLVPAGQRRAPPGSATSPWGCADAAPSVHVITMVPRPVARTASPSGTAAASTRASPTSAWRPTTAAVSGWRDAEQTVPRLRGRFTDKVRWFAGLYGATLRRPAQAAGADRRGTSATSCSSTTAAPSA